MPGETEAQLIWNICPFSSSGQSGFKGEPAYPTWVSSDILRSKLKTFPLQSKAPPGLFFSPIVNPPFLASVQSFPGIVWNCANTLHLASVCVCANVLHLTSVCVCANALHHASGCAKVLHLASVCVCS